MDIQQAQKAAEAAIARLADAGHRATNEHAYALDQLRQENEALRRQNQALRERVAELERVKVHTHTREQLMADGTKALTFGLEPDKPSPWTPKVGDRVRIAREPHELGYSTTDWNPSWGKVGDVGVIDPTTSDMDDCGVCVRGVGDGLAPYWIDPSCLEPVPDVQPVDTEDT